MEFGSILREVGEPGTVSDCICFLMHRDSVTCLGQGTLGQNSIWFPVVQGTGRRLDAIVGRSGRGIVEQGDKKHCSHLAGCQGLVERTLDPERETEG